MKRKILYISGSRADYGLMRSVLRNIHNHPGLSLDIVVTGMHLMEGFGNTIDEIKEDGFSYHIVDVQYEDDTKESMAIFIGKFIQLKDIYASFLTEGSSPLYLISQDINERLAIISTSDYIIWKDVALAPHVVGANVVKFFYS